MQTLVEVYCTKGPSVREKIARDHRISKHNLCVTKEQQAGRQPGWLKLRSTVSGRHGAVNIVWHADKRVLSCRVVTKTTGTPSAILGDLVEYLVARFRARVQHVMVVPR